MRLLRTIAPVLAALMLCNAAMADEPAPSRITFNIPQQPLADALAEWSKQSGLQVLRRERDTNAAELTSAQVSGEFSAAEALSRMLARTGLKYEFVNDRTVRIASASPEAATSIHNDNGLRLAQSENPQNQDSPQQTSEAEQSRETNSSTSSELEGIVVTAQRREERLQDVPISISVLTGEQLDSASVTSLNELLPRVPGVFLGNDAVSGGTQITIRGVGSAQPFTTGPSPAAYYLDAVPFGTVRSSFVPDTSVYDLDRVEVLRGPQGTLFGASAESGVVRVLTRDPALDDFEFKARGLLSTTQNGAENGAADFAMNAPLVSNQLAIRFAGGYQNYSGWIDKVGHEDANDNEQYYGRLKVRAELGEDTEALFGAWVSRIRNGGYPTATDGEGRFSAVADVEADNMDFDTYSLKIIHDFDTFALTSSTSYLTFVNDSRFTQDFGTPVTRDLAHTRLSGETFAQEIYLSSRDEGPWRWTLGGMYRDGEDEQFQDVSFATFPERVEYTSESWAMFGELTRMLLNEKLEVTVGLRYFEDVVGQNALSSASNSPPPANLPPPAEDTFQATTPRVVLNWHPDDNLTFYASYSQGFRSGLQQGPAIRNAIPSVPDTEPDRLTNYEVGSKGRLLGGALDFETALYFMDWQDVQLPLFVTINNNPGRTILINGASASGAGVDLSLTAHPIDGLDIGTGISWNTLEVDSPVLSNNFVLLREGDRLNGSLKRTVSVFGSYSFPLTANLNGRFSASADFQSAQQRRTLAGTTVITENIDATGIGRARFSIEADSWIASLFAENISNEDQALPVNLISVAGGESYIRPRTIGVQLEYRFD